MRPSSSDARRLSPLLAIFLTVFLDLLAFGLILPDIQLRGKELGAQGWQIGLVIAIYSIAQLLIAPFLGRLSDRIGRRKILLATTLLAGLSFWVYGHATELWMMMVARALGGVAGANLGVAFAYIADVTKPEERSKGLGLVGAAFGLGFILGPPIGALLVRAGDGSPIVLGYVAAILSLLNFVYVLRVLPESRKPGTSGERQPGLVHNFRVAFRTPGLAILLAMFFALNLGFTNLESTFFSLLERPGWIFSLTADEARLKGALILGFVGIVGAFMQGYLIRKLTPRFGEVRLLRFGYLLMVPGLALTPFAPLWVPMLAVVLLLGIGSGVSQPSMSSLISRNAPKEMQGGIFGITQSLGATARVLGPLISNNLFPIQPYYPYLVGAALVLFPAIAAWWLKMPKDVGETEGVPAH